MSSPIIKTFTFNPIDMLRNGMDSGAVGTMGLMTSDT